MHTHRHSHNCPALFSGRGSRIYDVVARRFVRRMYRRIADDLVGALPQNADLLDIGTGPGVLLVELATRRPDLRLTGIDLSADMIALAQRNTAEFGDRVWVRVADCVDLPFADASFDAITTSLSSHHWDDPAGAVPELARVLRPGGRFYDYDLRFAPFDELVDTARERGVLSGEPVQRIKFRTGVPLLPCARQVMTA
jgi:ubiquinone/menaquinone biosynthesis C-methylase UbiE